MNIQRKPDWLKIKLAKDNHYLQVKSSLDKHRMHTICISGDCPNMGECWSNGTATFMILGDICTRNCKFCSVKTGKPLPIDESEPERLALSIKELNIKHAVITSVDRDDLKDFGAQAWHNTILTVRKINPQTTIEVLVPDFQGNENYIQIVLDAKPDIISHNLETVKRLSPIVRSKASYEVSLSVLKYMSQHSKLSKTGIMLGLGETIEEVYKTMDDSIDAGVKIFTIGQYLQPSRDHYPVSEYIHPDVFSALKNEGLKKGFKYVESGPLVRSSYHAKNHIN